MNFFNLFNLRIDDIEDEIYREKLKIKKVSDELNETFDDMLNNYWDQSIPTNGLSPSTLLLKDWNLDSVIPSFSSSKQYNSQCFLWQPLFIRLLIFANTFLKYQMLTHVYHFFVYQ